MPILEYPKRSCSVSVWLAASALLTAAFLVPPDAAAHIARCNSPALLPGDEERVTVAARRILPPNVEPVVSRRCVLQNRAYAEITTAKVPDGPGTTHWWVADCHRELGDWICNPAQFMREIVQRLVINGKALEVSITMDSGTPIEAAQSIVTRALELYLSPSSTLPYCGGLEGGESRWRGLRVLKLLPSGEARIPVVVQQFVKTAVVLFDEIIRPDDMKIQLQFPIGSENQDSTRACWSPMAA